MPKKLDPGTKYKGPHPQNRETAKAKLLELNPGHNAFIYWCRIQFSTERCMRDSDFGTFSSQNGTFVLTYSYDYYVFREGKIVLDGTRRFCTP